MTEERKVLIEIRDSIRWGLTGILVFVALILIVMLSGCTTITVTKPDATYSVTVPPFVKADSVSISRDGDDWTFDLDGGSTGDIEAITEAVTAGVVRGMK